MILWLKDGSFLFLEVILVSQGLVSKLVEEPRFDYLYQQYVAYQYQRQEEPVRRRQPDQSEGGQWGEGQPGPDSYDNQCTEHLGNADRALEEGYLVGSYDVNDKRLGKKRFHETASVKELRFSLSPEDIYQKQEGGHNRIWS